MDAMNYRVGTTAAAMLALAITLPISARAVDATDPLEVSISSERITETPQLAWWEDQTARISHRVSYADLDLSKSSDVAVLKDRIDRAAYLICKRLAESYPEASLAGEQSDEQTCIENAEAGAMDQVRYRIGADQAH